MTLTVGGNDVSVEGVAATCTTTPLSCASAITAAQLRLPQLAVDLATTHAGIAAAAPKARILVTGYPLQQQLLLHAFCRVTSVRSACASTSEVLG